MKLTTTLLTTSALTLAAASAQAQEMSNEMTLVSWGGAYQSSQQNAYVEPYLEMHPEVSVAWDESSNEAVAKLRAMNEAGNVTWDLVDVVASDAIRLCDEGLAMEYDPDELLADGDDGSKASDDFGDLIVSDCYIPQIVYSTTFGYRTDMVPEGVEAPNDICDVFDLETYPGKRSLEKRPINNMEWALLCDGVAKDEVYDVLETSEGQDQALAKLGTIKDEVIWWSAGADTPQLLADGEIFMGSTYNGRLFSVIEEQDQPVAMMWDAQVFDLDGWIIPAGLPEERLARVKDFLRFATDTQRLADQAKYISYGPARASSAPLVGQHAELGIDMAPHMPTDPANAENTFLYNYEFWADYRDDIDAKFQAWLAQ
ncbi:extracellular solute-binding protein [Ponticoccus alexandrii]|uniref:Extracellular solute-binding protein n=1 Tax=Ponticoccus alexandrii TaxID=1943633 RepID=A0ABX7FDA4_9RHOB|nr:extracellular solute-binding protein [Ponticoccus alexandrii]ETA52810.1 spermidine/putrescine ABC transporter substrate-binding protein [Rhodobacteraceae bacterium PD-2]QRF67658.1 extracellular solute-binding protein [Ponticoccus alexandrii]